ncbi:MAG: amino acid adenylation domain-containing protein, partial [Actinocatenispora sp.]
MTEVPRDWTDGPAVEYPSTTVGELVLAWAADRPDAVAVRQWDVSLTYGELVAAASELAGRLRAVGVGPEVPVAVCLRRRPEAVVAILGVLLAGGVHLPLDPDHPVRRLRDIVADAGVRVAVGDGSVGELLGVRHALTVPAASGSGSGDAAGSGDMAGSAAASVTGPVAVPAGPDNTAYVLYTSGSTGRPKGVVVTHRSVVAYLTGLAHLFTPDEGTVSVSFSSFGFDAFVGDLLLPLTVGGQVALLGEEDRADPDRAHRFINEHGANWGVLTAALLPVLDPAATPGWTTVLVGGEVLPPDQVARWSPGRRFVNVYGPTETTVMVTCHELTGAETGTGAGAGAAGAGTDAGGGSGAVPIGRPFPNHQAYVVDAGMRQTPVGEPGELLIGGPGVARGYLNRPELTADRFVDNPFRPGERVYRTGDLASWRPDGTLDFHGRIDRQVKIRGQRLEIGEVEAALRSHPGVRQVAVEAVDGPRGRELVGFVVADGDPAPADLAAHCAEMLPAYMVPARILPLPAMPISSAGKVDVTALRELAAAAPAITASTGAAPVDPVEVGVRRAWCDILACSSAGPDDDFFGHGGHSVAAMRLAVRLRAELDRAVAVEDVFAGRTLGGLIARVAAAEPTDASLPTGNPARLSPAQRRLWFLERLAPDSTAYNVPVAERLRGPLDVDALAAALGAVAGRHDVLRWRIPHERGEPYATVDPVGPVPLPVHEVTEDGLRPAVDAFAREPFTLAEGPLWRARLYRLGAEDHVLALSLHHAVFDGWSQAPLFRDLADEYRRALPAESLVDPSVAAEAAEAAELAEVAAPLRAGYADYVAWRADRDARRGEADLAWWRERLAGAPTVLDLPRDRPRSTAQTYAGAEAHTALPAEVTERVRQLAAEHGSTPAMTLGAAFGHLLGRLTGAAEVVFGTPTADRRHAAFADLVGFFIEVVPVRLATDPEANFGETVRACRDAMLDALAHPATPLEKIVDALGVRREASRAPLVQVLFNAYNFPEPRLDLAGVTASAVPVAMPGSPFDLTAYLVERDGRFAVDVLYNPDLYDADRIGALLDDYLTLVSAATAEPSVPLGKIRLSLARPGVVDPEPAAAPEPVADDGPLSPMERRIADVWCEVLGIAQVGPSANFFEVGGTSMTLVAVQVRLTEVLGRPLHVVDLFRFPNVRLLARFLEGEAGDSTVDRAAARAALRRGRRAGRG